MRLSKPTIKLSSDDSGRRYIIDIQNITPTFGHSIGNAVVRGLMNTPCFKPKAYKIENVEHEFDSIRSVIQGVDKISNNITRLVIQSVHGTDVVEYYYDGIVNGKLRASDLKSEVGLPIVNSNLVILETESETHIGLKIIAERGQGHELPPYPKYANRKMIQLPIVYSDIHASYEIIENDPYINTETIRLYVSSEGCNDIKDAMEIVSRQFTAYFDIIANTFASISIAPDKSDDVDQRKLTKYEFVKLEDLNLSTEAYDRLKLHHNEVRMKDGQVVLLPKEEEREESKRLLESCGLSVTLI